MLSEALDGSEGDLDARCTQLQAALERAWTITALLCTQSDSSASEGVDVGLLLERRLGDRLDQSKEISLALESVHKVRAEIQRCKDAIARQQEEEAKRALELESERRRQEKEKQAAEQREQERQQKEKEALMREAALKEEDRQKMEQRLHLSLEKHDKEKRSGLFRRLLVHPITNKTVTPPESIKQDAFAEMEVEVQRLLEDDSPSSSQKSDKAGLSCCTSDANQRVRGLLESLDDPWGIQSEEPDPAPVFSSQNTSLAQLPASLDIGHYRQSAASDPLETLLAQRRAPEGIKLQSEGSRDCGFQSRQTAPRLTQIPDPVAAWSVPVSAGLVGRRSAPLDSSAPAFYPSASSEVLSCVKPVSVFSSAPMIPSLSPTRRPMRRLEIPRFTSSELPPQAVSPFPGVGAGIPGTPSRSLSETLERVRQLSITKSDQNIFSKSGDF